MIRKTVVVLRLGQVNQFLRLAPKVRFFSKKRVSSAVARTDAVPKYPWIEQADPNGSGKRYYWNEETDETTHLGSGRPNHWVEVEDPQGTRAVYWWNPETNETTAVGEPRPSLFSDRNSLVSVRTEESIIRPFGIQNNLDVNRASQQQQQQLQQPSFGKTMLIYAGFGVGMTFAAVAVRGIFGF